MRGNLRRIATFYDAMQHSMQPMTLRRTLTAFVAALPVAFGFAVYASRPRRFDVRISSTDVDPQLFSRNDEA